MVNMHLAERALADAEEWLQSADKLREIGAGPKILYSLEMGVEFGVKALLLYHGIDFPKTHNILSAVVNLISSDKFDDAKIKENAELIFSTFHALLDLRSACGYSYESSYSREFFIEKAKVYAEPASQVLALVRQHILSGNK
ncbi:MAG: HEPN domain-containing protein [Thermoplasmataceae archaeon]